MKRHCFTFVPFFALIGLMLSPLAVAHASPPFDHERGKERRREHPRLAAAKPSATLDVGPPRTVRMIYFLPKDKPYRQEAVDAMKAVIGRVQTFYAEQMQMHGYGNLTFRFETDAQGEPVVHRFDGKHPSSHYTEGPIDEISEVFDLHRNIYSIVAENDGPSIGAGSRLGKNGGYAWLDESYTTDSETWYTATTAHEIGHAFGLHHDFRDDTYIMSYGYGSPDDRISASAAEFLSVHPYFNPAIPIEAGQPPTVELISPTRYPAGSQSVSIRLKVSDPTGIHQVCLQTIAYIGLAWEVTACQGVSGKTDAAVEFDYDGVIPSSSWWSPQTSLSNPPVHDIQIMAIDKAGNAEGSTASSGTMWEFSLAEKSPDEIAFLEAYSRSVHSLALSPDGALLAFLYGRDTVRLWDVATQKQLATLDHGQSVAFSRDGTLAIGSLSDTRLWDVATRKGSPLKGGGSLAVTFSSDGSLLATASDDAIRLWDVATRKQVAMLDIDLATSLAFSPDGTTLAFVSGYLGWDPTVQLWDVATQKQLATLDHGQLPEFTSLAFSPDGTTLATGHREWHRTVALWDVETWEQVAVLERQGTGAVTSVAFSPDGALLASAGGIFNNTVRLWDVRTRQEIVSFGHTDPFFSVAFSLDGATLAAGSEEAIILWDVSERTGDPAGVAVGEQEPDGEIVNDESSGEDQPESGGQPTTAVEFKGISASHDSVRENDGQATTITLTVTLDKTAATDETITLTLVSPLVGKTAKRNEDFEATFPATITIAKGQRTGTAQLVLTPKDNQTAEGDKAFAVQVTSSSGHQALINIKITDDDQTEDGEVAAAPPAPTNLRFDTPAATSCRVRWDASDGATDYDINYKPAAGGQWTNEPHKGVRLYSTIYDLQPATEYRWAVRAENSEGYSEWVHGPNFTTASDAQASLTPPTAVALADNFPNPFNPTTTIQYALPQASHVQLTVYNVAGQAIRALVAEHQRPGHYVVEWDATDDGGQPVSAGVYFYCLKAGETFRQVKRMVLLK